MEDFPAQINILNTLHPTSYFVVVVYQALPYVAILNLVMNQDLGSVLPSLIESLNPTNVF